MGYNRAGHRRKLHLRRQRREQERLLGKRNASAASPPEAPAGGLTEKVVGLAKGVAETVGGLVKAAGQKVKAAVTHGGERPA